MSKYLHYRLLSSIPALRIIFILILTGAGSLQAEAQKAYSYNPLKDDSLLAKTSIDNIKKRCEADVNALSGKNKKYIADVYEYRAETIKQRFADKEIITSGEETAYLSKIVSQIIRNNPALQQSETRVFFSRAYWPNAYSTGEGTIIFNIGLFCKFTSEGQVAFTLCHELAHYFLNHGNRSIENYINTIYSDEYQKKLKEIKNTQYQKREMVENLDKNFAFKSRRHSREHESEADSMAIEFMKNSGFDLNEAVSCMAILDSADKDKYQADIDLNKNFDFPSYHFKKSWLEEEESIIVSDPDDKNENSKYEDSLKTHPDCKVRMTKLLQLAGKYNKPDNKKFIIDEPLFNKLRQKFDFEIIEYCFQSGRQTLALYYALKMLNDDPSNSYLRTMVGRCFNSFYLAQKNHELNKIADLPSPDYKKQYNDLLHFVQNLRLTEIAALSYYYMQQYQESEQSSEEFVAALINSKENYGKPDEKTQWLSYFKKTFPNSKYKF